MENSFNLTRRRALGLAAAGFASSHLAKNAVAASAAPILVELFTSQGCSSCPPADKLAGELANMPGVMVVSLNVDYWDYLGWRDTLAKPEYTQRQMDYAHARGDMDVYTPQMIINGAAHEVGSNKSSVEMAIASARQDLQPVTLNLQTTATELIVEMSKGEAAGEATLWIMAVAPKVSVVIERGENKGQSITYHNVVRKLVPAGMWDGTSSTLKLPRKAIMLPDCRSCIAVLQKGKVGPVLASAKWDL
jgi:hypothetical protein